MYKFAVGIMHLGTVLCVNVTCVIYLFMYTIVGAYEDKKAQRGKM